MKQCTANGGFPRRHAKKRGDAFSGNIAQIIEKVVPKDKSVVDLGAGAYGTYVRWMLDNGWESVTGVDGSWGVEKLSKGLVKFGDLSLCLTVGDGRMIPTIPDWIISFEVGEHIPPEHAAIFMDNLSVAKEGILMSWALPGQKGFHHVNCQMIEWVACEMGKRGFSVDDVATMEARTFRRHVLRKRLLVLKRD